MIRRWGGVGWGDAEMLRTKWTLKGGEKAIAWRWIERFCFNFFFKAKKSDHVIWGLRNATVRLFCPNFISFPKCLYSHIRNSTFELASQILGKILMLLPMI